MAAIAKQLLEAPEYSPVADQPAYDPIRTYGSWYVRRAGDRNRFAAIARSRKAGYTDIVRTSLTPHGLEDLVQQKVDAARPQQVSPRTPTVVFNGRLNQALPLLEPLKFTWVRGGSSASTNVGVASEQVAGLVALQEPGERLYRLVSRGNAERALHNTSAIYVLATPDEFAGLSARLDKFSRQRAAKQFSEALISRLLA